MDFTGTKSLHSSIIYKVDQSGVVIAHHNYEYRVETEQGRTNLSNFREVFDGVRQSFELVSVEVETKEKKILSDIKLLKISEIQNTNFQGIITASIANLPINGIEVGSKVSVKYNITEQPIVPGVGTGIIAINNSQIAPTEFYKFESEKKLYFSAINLKDYYEIVEESIGAKFSLTLKPLPKAYSMVGAKLVTGLVYVSTSSDWLETNSFLSKKYESTLQEKLPIELKKISNLAKNKKNSKDTIEFVSKEIAKLIAYSGNWTDSEGRYFPQKFKKILETKRGDCKDYSIVLVSILRSLGYTAYPALTFRSPTYLGKNRVEQLSKISSLSHFNHAIVWAKDKNGIEWWIDPTNPAVLADVISPDILGNFSLILNGDGRNVSFLPEANKIQAETIINQSIKIVEDTVEAKGEIFANDTANNHFLQLEKFKGLEPIKDHLKFTLLSTIKAELTLKQNETKNNSRYSFNYISQSMIIKNLNDPKEIQIVHPAHTIVYGVQRNQTSYVGELGTYKLVTKLEGISSPTTYKADCYVRTPWLNIDRFVELKNNSTVITDKITILKRVIEEAESENEEFGLYFNEIENCISSYKIQIEPGKLKPNDPELHNGIAIGPDPYFMTVKDLDKLFPLTENADTSYIVGKKLMKFYNLHIQKDPKNLQILNYRASRMRKSGWIRGNYYLSAYVKDALVLAEEILKINNNNFFEPTYSILFLGNLDLKQYQKSAEYLQIIANKSENKFLTGHYSYLLAHRQEAFPLANAWREHLRNIARSPEEIEMVEYFDYDEFERTKNYKAMIKILEKRILNDPKNAWVYHNAALIYFEDNQLDKAIEYEKKAISIKEFGMANSTLAKIYKEKAIIARFGTNRNVASLDTTRVLNVEDYEKYLLESLKYNSTDQKTLAMIIELYLNFYTRGRSDSNKAKVLHYLNILVDSHPNTQTTERTVKMVRGFIKIKK